MSGRTTSDKNALSNLKKSNKSSVSGNKAGKSKNRKKFRLLKIIMAVFILIYIPCLIYWFIGSRIVATDIIRTGKIEDSVNVNALLIRDELVLKAPIDGEYIPYIDEGYKVAAKSVVAAVVDNSYSEIINELNAIDEKILTAMKETGVGAEIFSSDISKIESDIESKIGLLVEELNSNRFDKIKKIKYEIDKLMQKKTEISGGSYDDHVYIKTLKEQKNKLMQNLNKGMYESISDISGVVSYNIDGYEEVLTPDGIDKLTPEIFESIMTAKIIQKDIGNWKVEMGKPYVKVVKDFQYQIAVCMDSDKSGFLVKGKKVLLRINDINKQMRGSVSYVSEDMNGKKIIVILVDKYLSEIVGLRKVNVDLIKSSYEGLIVPLKSLRNIDYNLATAEIVLLKGDTASVRTVKIVGYNDEYAVVESESKTRGISLYDTYIKDPENIVDGQVVKQ